MNHNVHANTYSYDSTVKNLVMENFTFNVNL